MTNRDDKFRASIAAAAASDDVRGEDEGLVEVMARAMAPAWFEPHPNRSLMEFQQARYRRLARRALDALRRHEGGSDE